MLNKNQPTINYQKKYMKYKLFNLCEEELESIKTFLETHFLPENNVLKMFSKKLQNISLKIDQELKTNSHQILFLNKQKKLSLKLLSWNYKIYIRKKVIAFAEEAEQIANVAHNQSQQKTQKATKKLRNKIQRFLQIERPSHTNMKFVRFALLCAQQAENKENALAKNRLPTKKNKKVIPIDQFFSTKNNKEREDVELWEFLYETALLLYQKKYAQFQCSYNTLSEEQKKDIAHHIAICQGSLDIKEMKKNTQNRLKSIQGILGYIHKNADYYIGTTPYPTMKEIRSIFQDLCTITKKNRKCPTQTAS